MTKVFLKIFSSFLLLVSSYTYAQPLPVNSSEYKQLQAMGYDIKSNDPNWSVVSFDGEKYALQKQSDRVVIAKYFTRKKNLNQQQELELYRVINKITIDYLYQIGLGEDYIAFVIYVYGPYDSKTFSKLMKYIENTEKVLDEYPEISKLIN